MGNETLGSIIGNLRILMALLTVIFFITLPGTAFSLSTNCDDAVHTQGDPCAPTIGGGNNGIWNCQSQVYNAATVAFWECIHPNLLLDQDVAQPSGQCATIQWQPPRIPCGACPSGWQTPPMQTITFTWKYNNTPNTTTPNTPYGCPSGVSCYHPTNSNGPTQYECVSSDNKTPSQYNNSNDPSNPQTFNNITPIDEYVNRDTGCSCARWVEEDQDLVTNCRRWGYFDCVGEPRSDLSGDTEDVVAHDMNSDPIIDQNFMTTPTEIGMGAWAGDCGGPGFFPRPQIPSENNIYTNNLYYSRTGCYNPEERFVYIDGRFDIGDGNDEQIGRLRKGVPRDDILNLHPACLDSEAIDKNQVPGLTEYNRPSLINPSPVQRYLAKEDKINEISGRTISCLYDDYIDDIDAFCSDFSSNYGYKTTKWYWHGLTDPVTGDPLPLGEQNCWHKKDTKDIIKLVPGEHWMPLALEAEADLDGSGTIDDGEKVYVDSGPYANRYGFLGDYGYRNRRISRGDPENANQTFLGDLPYRRNNVYNWNTPPTSEQILSINNMGAKRKKMECLKVYVEEWAHRGDCGEIVIEGAGPEVNSGMCQWVKMYDSHEVTSTNELGRTVLESVFDALDVPARSEKKATMRSEFFDYENFNRMSFIPRLAGDVGSIGFGASETDICMLDIASGTNERFWEPTGIDFSKRGCPTVSGPNFWPEWFDQKCTNSWIGYKAFKSIRVGGGKTDANFLPFTTFIDNHGDLATTTPGKSELWGLGHGGFKIPIWGGTSPIWVGMVSPTDFPYNGTYMQKVDDWVDYSWTAASCSHGWNRDYWNETPDIKRADFENLAPANLGNEIEGFSFHENGYKMYSWKINPTMLGSPAMWCEFELPYYPFGGRREVGAGTGITNHLEEAAQGHNVYHNMQKRPVHLEGDDEGKLKAGKLEVRMVERIRDACSAFSQRGTWQIDKPSKLHRWLTGKANSYGLCADWKGLYGRKYSQPVAVNWRLPRFNYEFLKAFVECTGPVKERGPNPCDGFDSGRFADNMGWGVAAAISGNGFLAVYYFSLMDDNTTRTNDFPWDEEWFGALNGIDITFDINDPAVEVPFNGIWGRNSLESRDHATAYSQDMTPETELTEEEQEDTPDVELRPKPGFWCSCPGDRFATTRCNENLCTCTQGTAPQVPGILGFLYPTYCANYGPYRRWLQCFYQARAKACPVLTREISSGITNKYMMMTTDDSGREANNNNNNNHNNTN